MTALKKQKPNLAIRLDDDLEGYLRARATEAHRTVSGEVRLRLEQSRMLDQQRTLDLKDPTMSVAVRERKAS